MGRRRTIACSLLIASAYGCSAVMPVQEGPCTARKKVLVDAEWSVKQPSAELLEAVRDGQTGGLPQQTEAVAHHLPSAPRRPSDILPAEGSPAPLAAATPSKGYRLETSSGFGVSPKLRPSPSLGRAPQIPMAAAAGTERSARCDPKVSACVPPENTRAAGRGGAAAVDQPGSLHAIRSEPQSSDSHQHRPSLKAAKAAKKPLEAHDLRLKAIACDARGDAVAQLELPDQSTIFVRPGQQLQLPSAGRPAEVRIEQIDGAQVQLQFNETLQVLTLR